jgi:predicted NBD/HSP70 family sugar kinase
MLYCGIDVHKHYMRICVITEDGDVIATPKTDTQKSEVQRWASQWAQMQVVPESGGRRRLDRQDPAGLWP